MSDIIKADGSIERFDVERLRSSLVRAGAGEHTARNIADTVSATVRHGMRSHEIYQRAFRLLRKEGRPIAARYALRRALLELGPSGHPFEDFVARIFEKEGWQAEWRKIIKGRCVSHEVDLYAHKNGNTLIAELKYHNTANYKTDVKVALYVRARFEDIWACDPKARACPVERGFLITNTKFTSEAIAYATCVGMELIGWGYPERGNLYERMCTTHVYPITALTTLKRAEKKLLIDAGVVSCDMLYERRDALAALKLSTNRVGAVLAETDALLTLPHPYGQEADIHSNTD